MSMLTIGLQDNLQSDSEFYSLYNCSTHFFYNQTYEGEIIAGKAMPGF